MLARFGLATVSSPEVVAQPATRSPSPLPHFLQHPSSKREAFSLRSRRLFLRTVPILLHLIPLLPRQLRTPKLSHRPSSRAAIELTNEFVQISRLHFLASSSVQREREVRVERVDELEGGVDAAPEGAAGFGP